MARRYHIIGNWKMNQDLQKIKDLFAEMSDTSEEITCATWIAPQAIHIPIVKEFAAKIGNIEVGAQNCSHHTEGAHTGEVSPTGLSDIGATFAIIGHSERRTIYGEDDTLINKKIKAALTANLHAVLCVGENLEDREANRADEVIVGQLNRGLEGVLPHLPEVGKLLIAYEPVWAIGTGKTATPEMAGQAHQTIRSHIEKMGFEGESTAILYGGSVKEDNIARLLEREHIDGALVGGASLSGKSFKGLCRAATLAK